MISTLDTGECETRKTYVFMLVASILFIGLAFTGTFDWKAGLVLLAAVAFMLSDAVRDARKHRREVKAAAIDPIEDVEGADPDMPWWKICGFLALGLVGLPLGANLLVENASIIARLYGVSDSVIGLTLVAVGTSLPELATTVMAALRRQADVALGNVIGSNMFNLLAIIGVTSFVGPIPVDPEFLRFDLWVMLAASLVLFPFVWMGWNMSRLWGAVFTGLYAIYIAVILI
jgi:cation:H+ antiporter